jgi:putative transposase
MPVKNRVKIYKSGGIYHIYNRGIDGKEIFRGEEDMAYFMEVIRRYLDEYKEEPENGFKSERPYLRKHRQDMNLTGKVDLIAYCLMPDHIHILVRQHSAEGITQLIRRVMTNYVMYFNKKYKRSGVLFENVYRAILLPDDRVVVGLSRYLHLNPVARVVKRFGLVETVTVSSPEYYMYSSYQNYLDLRKEEWVKSGLVLEMFKRLPESQNQSYRQYVEGETKRVKEEISDWVLE